MSEFIEFLSPKAQADLDKANESLLKMISNVEVINQKMSAVKTPSGSDSAIKELTEQYKAQEKVIASLQKQLAELTKTKSVNNQKSSEEIVNQRVLRTNSDRHALSTSKLAGEYRNLSAQVAIASEKYQNLIVRGKLATQTQSQYNAELRKAQNEFRTLQTRVLAADKAVDKWGRTNQRSIAFGRDLLSAFGIVGGVTAFALITKDIFEEIKQIQSLDNALKLVTGSQENFYAQQVFLNDISERYGVSINDLTKQFTQFYVSAKDKISSSEIQNIFESITKAGASMGLSVENQQRAFLALNQMMSKGTIQAEELRGQLGEALPGAFGIMAKAVGVTEQELAKMMKAGQLIASDVLPKFAKQLEKTYGIENVNRVETLTSAQNRLSNSWTALIRSFNDSENGGISKFFKFMIDNLTDVINLVKEINQINDPKSQKIFNQGVVDGEKEALRQLNEQKKAGIANDAQIAEDAELKREYAKKQVEAIQWEINALEQKAKLEKESRGEGVTSLAMILGFSGTATKEQIEAANALVETNKKINELSRSYGYYTGVIKGVDEFQKKVNDTTKKTVTLTKEQIEARKKALEDEAKQNNENRKKELELELQVIDRTLNDDEVFYNTRLRALDLHFKKRNEILLLNYNEELRQSKGNLAKQKEAMLNFHSETLKEIENYNKKRNELEALELKPADVIKGDSAQKQLNDNAEQNIKNFEKQTEAANKYKASLKEVEYATDNFIKSFQTSFMDDAGLGSLFDILDGRLEEFGDNWKAKTLLISEAMQEMFNFISEISQANFQQEKAQNAEQAQIAEAFANGEQTAIDEIRRQKEAKDRDIARREFKAKKDQAKFNIGIDVAQAIMATYARVGFPAGLPLALIMGAIGLAQISIVEAQKIPAYKDGTDNHIGGAMLINDGNGSNFKEIIETPDGKRYAPQHRNMIVDAPKGTKVLNYEQQQKELDSILLRNNIDYSNVKNDKQPIIMLDTQSIVSAIENKSELHQVIDHNGYKQYISNGHLTKQLLNSQVKFKSQSV